MSRRDNAEAFAKYEDSTRYRAYQTGNLTFTGDTLFSYRMPLAYRTHMMGKRFVIVNGEGSPSNTTSGHMSHMRSALSKENLQHAFIPYSSLRTAGIGGPEEIEVVHVTEDRTDEIPYIKPDGTEGTRYRHFLGETLFTHKGRYYVCGLDRNDNPIKRMFYLCKLPRGVKPKTVDEALESLRPAGLPQTTLRQGEWFFVPELKFKTPRRAPVIKKVPITSADPVVQAKGENARPDRHVASEVLLTEDAVMVRGVVKDDEHDTLRLGKVWHRVVKNLADEGWRYDKSSGTRVD